MKTKHMIMYALYCLMGTTFLGWPWVMPPSEFSRAFHLNVILPLCGLLNLVALILLTWELIAQIKEKKKSRFLKV